MAESSNESTHLLTSKDIDASASTELIHYESVTVNGGIETATYSSRWYVCIIFSLFVIVQSMVWTTWTPISSSVNCCYGISLSEIDLMTNWGSIIFLIGSPFVTWMINSWGLRFPNLLCSFAMSLGCGLMCLPLQPSIRRYIIHFGQILNGFAGCSSLISSAMIANIWFPAEERITATGIMSLVGYLGLSFIVGPAIVLQPTLNMTANGSIACNETVKKEISMGIQHLLYLQFGLSLIVFIGILLYFPNRPPKPPSASASIRRLDFMEGLKELGFNRNFIIMGSTFALVLGSFAGWLNILSIILLQLNVSQDTSANIGFTMSITGCLTGLAIGRFVDRFTIRFKRLILTLYSLSFVSYLYYLNLVGGWIEILAVKNSVVTVWVTCIMIALPLYSAFPLAIDMAVDAAYPTSEAVICGILVWLGNGISCALLIVMQFTDTSVTNYLTFTFLGVGILSVLLFFSERQSERNRIDEMNNQRSLLPST